MFPKYQSLMMKDYFMGWFHRRTRASLRWLGGVFVYKEPCCSTKFDSREQCPLECSVSVQFSLDFTSRFGKYGYKSNLRLGKRIVEVPFGGKLVAEPKKIVQIYRKYLQSKLIHSHSKYKTLWELKHYFCNP